MHSLLKTSLPIALFTFCNQSFAEQSSNFSVALMPIVFAQESIYLDGNTKVGFFPLPELHWKNAFFSEGKLGFTAFDYNKFSVDISIGGDYMGDIDRGDSKTLKDMTKLDNVITANIDLRYAGEMGTVTFGVTQDISNEHNGYTASAGYSYNIKLNKWFVEPSVTLTYIGQEVADYYYGVSAADASIDRPLYQPDETVSVNFSLSAGYAFDRNNMIIGFAGLTFIEDEIQNSPIVAKNKALTVGLGYRYEF